MDIRNHTSTKLGIAFRYIDPNLKVPPEDNTPNLYFPRNQINKQVNSNTTMNMDILTKVDPCKPVGQLQFEVLYEEVEENFFYYKNYLIFGNDKEPLRFTLDLMNEDQILGIKRDKDEEAKDQN